MDENVDPYGSDSGLAPATADGMASGSASVGPRVSPALSTGDLPYRSSEAQPPGGFAVGPLAAGSYRKDPALNFRSLGGDDGPSLWDVPSPLKFRIWLGREESTLRLRDPESGQKSSADVRPGSS
jgi:hypothetical protein